MKATIESTEKIVQLKAPADAKPGYLPARVWEGTTERGVRFHAYITRVAVAPDQDQSQFEDQLRECRAATPEIAALPGRLVL